MRVSDILDLIFEDEDFDALTQQELKRKQENQDPVVASFLEVVEFVRANNREPERKDEWNEERKLWARLQGFRKDPNKAAQVKGYDDFGLLDEEGVDVLPVTSDDESLSLDELLDQDDMLDEFSDLLDVSRYKKTVNAANKIGRRKRAGNFEQYRVLFKQVHEDIAAGRRKVIPFKMYEIEEGRFYVLNGVMLYVVSIGEFYVDRIGETNAKMHVVYENGTENKSLLFRGLASSLYAKKRHGRMVTDLVDDETLAESFGAEFTTGYIYVLKSLSTDPEIMKLENLHKIGFTRDSMESRIANAKNDMTYLNAPVRIVMSAEVKNINAQILERTLHHVFADKQIIFQNRELRCATEWFIVPLEEIEEKINNIVASLQK